MAGITTESLRRVQRKISHYSGTTPIPAYCSKESGGAKKTARRNSTRKAGSITIGKGWRSGAEPQAVTRRGNSRTIGEVRRGFIEAAVLEQGYQASEVASF